MFKITKKGNVLVTSSYPVVVPMLYLRSFHGFANLKQEISSVTGNVSAQIVSYDS